MVRTVARARGGEGPPWGFTVIPLVGDTCRAMQPQVSLTSGRAHTRAAPGDAPGYHIYVCMWCFGTGSHVCHGVTWAWAGRTTSALYPQSIDREVVHAQCYHTSTTFAENMSAVYHPILTWGRAATPGDTAGQGAAPPGATVTLRAARTWPLPPPCAGYRTDHNML